MRTSKYQTTGDVEAQYAGGQQPPGAAPQDQAPAPKGHRRPKWMIVLGCIIGGIVLVIGLALAFAPAPSGSSPSASPATTAPAQPATTAPAAAPVPSPDATGSGNADYVIPSGIYDPVYLTGEVDVKNTGNVGIVAKVKMHWERTGFADITQAKVVKVPYGQTVRVQFNKNVGSFSGNGGTVIDEVQSYQDAHMNSAYGNFNLTLVSTYGRAH